jgi:hypothetical protein
MSKHVENKDYFQIETKCGTKYKIDKDSFYIYEKYEWYRGHYGYLQTNTKGIKRFHRMILEIPEGMVVDHINRDVTDNRKINLRVVTQQQNSRNRANITGKYKGVSWTKSNSKWRATIQVSGKCKHLGYFEVEIEAAKAYDRYVLTELNGDGYINGVLDI